MKRQKFTNSPALSVLPHAYDQNLSDLVHVIVGHRVMVGASIVDNDPVIFTPYVAIDKFGSRAMLEQEAKQSRAFANR